MSKIRVLATKLGSEDELLPRLTYTAEVFDDGNDSEPVWTCVHEHKTPIAAQLCGVEFLTDRPVNRRHKGAA